MSHALATVLRDGRRPSAIRNAAHLRIGILNFEFSILNAGRPPQFFERVSGNSKFRIKY